MYLCSEYKDNPEKLNEILTPSPTSQIPTVILMNDAIILLVKMRGDPYPFS